MFRTFRAQLGKKTLSITVIQIENKHIDPVLLLRFLNVLYAADISAKFEKNIVHPFQRNYLKISYLFD